MPIWGVVNQKGGVGKTTTAVNLAAGLAERGLRTLLIDADPQGNATSGMGIEKARAEVTLMEVLQQVIDHPDDPLPRGAPMKVTATLDIIPATIDLAGAEPVLLNAVGKELILRDAISKLETPYDWILIDAPPSLGILTINILAASDGVLVPMQCEFYALEGLTQLMKTIEIVRRRINPRVEIVKVLMTMYDPRNKLTHQVTDEIREFFGERVSPVAIPRNVRLSEAPSFGTPAVQLFPESKGSEAYMRLVDEVIGR